MSEVVHVLDQQRASAKRNDTFANRAFGFVSTCVHPNVWYTSRATLLLGYQITQDRTKSDLERNKYRALTATAINDSVVRYTNDPASAIIPWTFRFSSFLPVNAVIAYTMLFNPGTGLARVHPLLGSPTLWSFLWQVNNRVYCVGLDYFNRNVGADMRNASSSSSLSSSLSSIDLRAFAGATVTALSAYFATKSLVGRLLQNRPFLGMYLPPAMALSFAHVFDLAIVRSKDWQLGLPVYRDNGSSVKDANGSEMLSQKVGVLALCQIGLQRILTANIVLGLPPLAMCLLRRQPLLQSRVGKKITELALIVLSLGIAVPLTQGIFPKTGSVATRHLEKEFQTMGLPEYCWFDKGL